MRKFVVKAQIERPSAEVFEFLSDPANLARWNSVMESAAWTSAEPPRVGSRYEVMAKMGSKAQRGLFEITQWEPPSRFGYRSVEIVFPFASIDSVIELHPSGSGTEVTFEGQFALAGLLRFAEGLFVGAAERGDGANLATAKRILEEG